MNNNSNDCLRLKKFQVIKARQDKSFISITKFIATFGLRLNEVTIGQGKPNFGFGKYQPLGEVFVKHVG